MKSLSDKDNIMNRLSNQLQYLAVGERGKFNGAQPKYVSNSRSYQNFNNRLGYRNLNPYVMNDRAWQLPPHYNPGGGPAHYNPGGLWPGTRLSRPRDVGVSPWSMPPPPQNWTYQIPKRKPSRKPRVRRNVPEGQWAVCWNFNSVRGCPRGTSCPWRHQKYSTTGNVRNEPCGVSTNEAITNVGQSRREAVKVQSRSHQKWAPETATKVVNPALIPSKAPPVQWIPNVKTRDIDTDSKMQQNTAKSVHYGYNAGEATESDTDESGVE